jgi:hypothetical protein
MTGAGGGASLAVCTNYCNAIMSNCTGVNQQYADMNNCLKICSWIPAGTPTDDGVHSVGCLTNAAKAATADAMQYKSKCFQAGPLSYGACGNDCDTFCAVVSSACPTAYKSMDDCENTCGQFSRQVEFGLPGTYGASYTPGTDADMSKDTLECRAYHLFIRALPGALAAECPNAANTSPACGVGVVPINITGEGGTTGTDGPVLGPYDGAAGSGGSSWDETKYPPSKRKMLLRDEGDPHLVMIDLSKTPILQWTTVSGGPWARSAQLIGNNQILGGRNDGYEVFDYTTGAIVKSVNTYPNTQSAYRLATGQTMLTRSGTVLTFLDRNDLVTSQISYPGYGFVRVARPTRRGTFLVPSDATLFEGDTTGKVLWKTTGAGWGEIWQALLLGPPPAGGAWNDGDTLVCTGFGASCDVVDKTTHVVTFRFGTKELPEAATVRPNFFAEFEILPNGNLVTSNWQGHGAGLGGAGLQVLEFDPAGHLVWFWKQDPTIFSSIQGVQVMDGKDPKYLYLQEASNDGTWQPVAPPP